MASLRRGLSCKYVAETKIQSDPQVQNDRPLCCTCRAKVTDAEVQEHIAARAAARKDKDFAKGDEIRASLASKGIMLCDGPSGTSWRPGACLAPESK